jgi:hypothetical protein
VDVAVSEPHGRPENDPCDLTPQPVQGQGFDWMFRPGRATCTSVEALAESDPRQPEPRLGSGASGALPLDVAAYLARWLEHIRGRVRAGTYEGYEVLLRLHAIPAIGHFMLAEIRPLDIQALYSQLLTRAAGRRLLAGGTVLNLHLVLTQAFGQAVRWQLLIANPVAGAQPPRPRRPPRLVVDPQLLTELLAVVAGSWLELPAAIAAATGMRRGEILALRWADLERNYAVARVQRSLQPTNTDSSSNNQRPPAPAAPSSYPPSSNSTSTPKNTTKNNAAQTTPPGGSMGS